MTENLIKYMHHSCYLGPNMCNACGATVGSEFLPNVKFVNISTHKINMRTTQEDSNLHAYHKISKKRTL